MEIINSQILLAFEITNNDLKFINEDINLTFELKTYHLPIETGGV